jgi:hypothetical protein
LISLGVIAVYFDERGSSAGDRGSRSILVQLLRYATVTLVLAAVLGRPAIAIFIKNDRAVGLVSLLPVVRVQPVIVHSVAKLEETPPDVQRIVGRPLYYLGQSSGTGAFFDTTTQKAVYIPTSIIIIEGRRPAKDIPLVEIFRRLFNKS